jgi:acetyl-CoA carboxylase biotin carboxyl carrier protein
MDAKELNELHELVEFLKANGIVKFEMERDGRKVALEFAGAGGIDTAHLATLLAAQGKGGGPAPAAAPSLQAAAAEADPHAGAHIVKSPIVGTFYDAPSPDAEPFVKVGDRVEAGKVLCIVEAMKLMNEIESDAAGEIVKIFVKAGQPVEYGQALFAIKQ